MQQQGQLDQMGEDTFLSTAKLVAQEEPEPAYELDQAAWAASIHKLMQVSSSEFCEQK
jgi:hypothetical protein